MHHMNQSCSFPEKFNKKKNANSVVTRAGQSNSLYMTFLVSAGFCNQHPIKKFITIWAVTLTVREGALTINFITDQVNNLIKKKHMWVSPSKTRLPVCLWQRLHGVHHLAWECLICNELHQMSEEKCTQLSSQFHDAHFDSSINNSYLNLQRTTTLTMGSVVSHVKTEVINISTKGEKERDTDHTLARGLESKQAG